MDMKSLFRTKPLSSYNSDSSLRNCLSLLDLTLLGIGAIIGAGIFVLTGIAAATMAGPAIVISYVISGLACTFTALSYAELAASIGGCGSAYGYAYVGLGEIIAWIIGWDLILEYAVSVSAVSVGWSHYVNDLLHSLGWQIPHNLLEGPLRHGLFNLPAVFIVLSIMTLLCIGVKESARVNSLMVIIKLAVIALFIYVAAFNVNPTNWHPFAPFGWSGIMGGAALIFFAYIGFDAVSTAAEEVIEPQRNLPIGIIASLVICTLLYIIVSGLLTGIVHYSTLNVSSPVSAALLKIGYHAAAGTVAVGAVAGLTTVILVMYYGGTRVILAMARDKLLPQFFAHVNPKTQTPIRIIVSVGLTMSLFSALIPIQDLAELVNIGTLFAFMVVCGGVIVLRYTNPEMLRPFKVPFSPLIPFLGIAFCAYLILSLPVLTWIRFFSWMLAGMFIYFFYSRFRSTLASTSNH